MAQVLLTAAIVQLSSAAERKPENFRLPGRPKFFSKYYPKRYLYSGCRGVSREYMNKL